jgi:hypothetical protein
MNANTSDGNANRRASSLCTIEPWSIADVEKTNAATAKTPTMNKAYAELES